MDVAKHFAYLATSPAGQQLVDELASLVVAVEEHENGELVVRFSDDEDDALTCSPARRKPRAALPAELKKLLRHHASLIYGRFEQLSLHDGTNGNFHALGEDTGVDPERDGFAYAKSIIAPIDSGTERFYVYPPKKQKLWRYDLDGGLHEEAESRGLGEVFLELLLDDARGNAEVRASHVAAKQHELDGRAISFLGRTVDKNATELRIMWDGTQALPAGKQVELSPLAILKQLRTLELDFVTIRDVAPLAALSKLSKLSLRGAPFSRLEPIAKLTKLENLSLDGTRVKDLKPLAKLSRLSSLNISSTPVKDLAPLAKLKKLDALYLAFTTIPDLTPLRALKLRFLDVDDAKLPRQQLDALIAANKHLEIEGEPRR